MHRPSWMLIALVMLGLTGCIIPNEIDPQKKQKVELVQEEPVVRTALRTFKTDHGMRLVLSSDFLFDPRSTRLKEGYERTLIAVYDAIIDAEPYDKILIRAYTDPKPDRFDAEHLTQLQADRIASYLWASGIARNKCIVHGMGGKKPVSLGKSVVAGADNRRVEIHIIQ